MKSKKNKKEKKVKKRKKSKSLTSSVVGSDDDMNLARKLYPLDHHIGDKAELVEQMFAIIQGGQLSAMLPPALKDLPVSELKSLCLVELVKLSTAQVKAVLSGDACPPDSDASGDSDAEKKNQPDSTSASEPLLSGLSTAPSFQGSQPNSKRGSQPGSRKGSQPSSQNNSQQEGQAGGTKLLTPVDEGKGGEDLTLMELLELEMRARAIKALLERDEGAPTPEQGASPPPPPPPPGSPPARVKASWKPVATPATDVVPPPPPTPPPPPPPSEPPPTAPARAPALDVSLPPPPPAPIIRPRSQSGSASPKPARPSKPRAYRKRRQSSSHSSRSGSSVSRSPSRGRRRSRRGSRSSSSRSRASGPRSPAARKKSRRASSSLSRHSSPAAGKPGTAGKRSTAQRTSRRASGSSSLSSVSSRSLSRSDSRHRRRRRRSSSYSGSSLSSRSSRSRSSRRRSRAGPRDKQSPAKKPDPPPTKRKPRPEELEEGEVNSEFESASDAEKEAEEMRWKEYNEEVAVELGDGEEKRRVPAPEKSQETSRPSVEREAGKAKEGSGQDTDEPEVKSNSEIGRSVEEVRPDEVAEKEDVTLPIKVEHEVVEAGEEGDTDNQNDRAAETTEAARKETEAEGTVEADHRTQDCVFEIPREAERVECVETTSITENAAKLEPEPAESAQPLELRTGPQRAASVVDDSDASGSRDSFHGFELESVVRSSRPPAGVTASLLEAEFSIPGRVDKEAPELASAGLERAEVTPEAQPAPRPSDAVSVHVGQESEAVKSRRSGRLRGAAAVEAAETASPVVGGRQRRGRGKQRSKPDNGEAAPPEEANEPPSKANDSSPENTSESPVGSTALTPPTARATRSSPRKAVATQPAAADAPTSRRSRTRSQGAVKLTEVAPAADVSEVQPTEEPAAAEPPAGRGRRRSRRQSPAAAVGRRSRTKSPAAATDTSCRSPAKAAGPEAAAPAASVQSAMVTPETPPRPSEPDAELSAECGDGSEPETPPKDTAKAFALTPPVVIKTDTPPQPVSPAAESTTPDASGVEESPTDKVELTAEVKPTVEVESPNVQVAVADGTTGAETSAEETRTVRVTKSPIRAPPEDVSCPAGQNGKAGGAGSPLPPESSLSALRSIVTKPTSSQAKGSSKLSSVVVVAPAVVMKEIGKGGGGDGVQLEKRLMTLAHGDQPRAEGPESATDETKGETGVDTVSAPALPPSTASAAAAGSASPAGPAPAGDVSPDTEAQLRSRGLGYWRELAAEAQHRYLAEEAETERLTRQEEGRLQELEARLQEDQEADDAGMAGHTWAVRWLQSDKVQKVVNNSKLYNKVKQKLKVLKQKAVKPKESEAEPKPEPKVQELPHVIGSIEEYERLFGKKVVVTESQTPATQTETAQTQASTLTLPSGADVSQPPPSAAAVQEDDDDDDDDELWGDIMGE